MRRRAIGMLLAAVIIFGTICGIAPSAAAASALTTSENCISVIKALEGFRKYPYSSGGQWYVGYGTLCPSEDRAEYEQKGITEAEADALMREYISEYEDDLNSFASGKGLILKQYQFDALLSFTYNLGPNWMNNDSSFRRAVLNQETGNDFIFAITRWCTADGKIADYLADRRLAEANMYLNGVYDNTPPSNYRYVIFEPNLEGAVNDVRIQGYDANMIVSIRATPSKSGYKFLGWYTEPSGGEKVTSLGSGTKVTTLYGHWQTSSGEAVKPEVTDKENAEAGVMVTVTGEAVNVRSGPGTNNAKVGKVYLGDRLNITETEMVGNVRWGKFTQGWLSLVYTDYETVVSTQGQDASKVTATGVVNTEKLNVRGGAGTNYPIVGHLYRGDWVEITIQKTVGSMVWGKIPQGWISMNYVDQSAKKPEPEKTEPVSPEQPPAVEDDGEEAIATGTVVNCTSLRIRSGPGTGNAQVGSLPKGSRVTIYEKTYVKGQHWGRIDQGWICLTGYVRLDTGVSEGGTVGIVVNCSSLNVRAGAGTDYAKVGKLPKGTQVVILETDYVNGSNWGKIDIGWVHMHYIELQKEGSTAAGSGTSGSNGGSNSNAAGEKMYGVVTGTDTLRIRAAAGTEHEQVGTLRRGDRVEILETTKVGKTTWGRISKGWISLYYVELDQEIVGSVKTVDYDYLNIRSGPGTKYEKIGTYSRGDRVTILETIAVGSTLWARTDRGWVSMDYLK